MIDVVGGPFDGGQAEYVGDHVLWYVEAGVEGARRLAHYQYSNLGRECYYYTCTVTEEDLKRAGETAERHGE